MPAADTANVLGSLRPVDRPPLLSAGMFMHGDAVDEKSLLEALRSGHESAFETMVRVYGGRLLSVARRITQNDEDARDVLQTAYLSAFRALSQFEGACQL